MRPFRSLFALSLCAVAACSPPPAVVAPDGLKYPGAPFVLTVGVELTRQVPTLAQGTSGEFTVSKALPAGLSFDTATGAISGTPAASAPISSYLVVASNAAGTAAVTFELTVTASGEPPSMLVYPTTDASYVVGAAILENRPTVQGSRPITFTVEPALPAGLSIDAATGAITGTPVVGTLGQAYVVTARNSAGTTTATLNIAVVDQLVPPVFTGYSAANVAYAVGAAIAPNRPTLSGSPPFTFSVAPALPAGLTLATSDGVITGTPTAASAKASYVVTASNPAGSAMFTLSIRVNAQATFAYAAATLQYVTPGTGIPPLAPAVLPTNLKPLTVEPALPLGLSLDPVSGVVTGSPSRLMPMPATVFTVTARDLATDEATPASFTLELLAPLVPGRPAGTRQPNGGPNGPMGPAGVVTNGLLIDVTDSFDGVACVAAGASLTPATATINVGDSVSWRLVSPAFHAWINSIQQQNAGSDTWPSMACLLLANQGSTCTFGVNHGGVTYGYANLHSAMSCPDPGSFTVTP